MDKERFFKIIDSDDHFNTKTKEAYWNFFVEKAGQSIETLYKDGGHLYPEKEGLQQYVKFSISKFFDLEKGSETSGNKAFSTGEDASQSKILPIDDGINHESATTWGTNDDVKSK